MKKILLLLLFCYFCPSILISQDTNDNSKLFSEPQDDANLILIYTSENPEQAYKTLGRHFYKSGYEFDLRDETLLLYSTRFKEKSYGLLGMGKLEIKLFAEIEQQDSLTVIKLTGKYCDNCWISNAGMSGSIIKSSWEFLNEFAVEYPNKSNLMYQIAELKQE